MNKSLFALVPTLVPTFALTFALACSLAPKVAGASISQAREQDASATMKPLAFPGAEGAGRFATGGRGGDVYHVTNLNDSGPGSFRDGVESAAGPRTIVFDVSGTIQLKGKRLDLDKSNITVAGQTAPGDGITFRDATFGWFNAHDLIIRFVRFRYGDKNKVDGDDTTTFEGITNSIIDHCSISWGVDGEHDQRRCADFTMQWSIIAEALRYSIHPKRHDPQNHGQLDHLRAMSFRDVLGDETIHHNIIASCGDRFPTLGGDAGTHTDTITNFSNNLMYDQVGATNLGKNISIIENNYYRPGPDSNYDKRKPVTVKAEPPDTARGWVHGNFFEGRDGFTKDNYTAIDYTRWAKDGRPTTREKYELKTRPAPRNTGIALQSAQDAYESVLQHAGASHARDAVDARVVAGIRDRTGHEIDSQSEVGGWPVLKSAPAPRCTNGDGIPDDWKTAHGLDVNDPDIRNAHTLDKNYTNLEVYLNSLVADIIR